MSWRTVFGVGLLVVGGGILLDMAGLLEFGEIVGTWWPMAIILVGVLQLLTRSVPTSAAVIVIVIGAVLQINQLDIFDVNLGRYLWPLAFILAGAYLLFSRSRSRQDQVNTDSRLNSFVAFGGVTQKIEAQPFEGGSAVSLFGGTELDLRGATLGPAGAELDLTSAFGGIEVLVPANWRVNMSGMPIFGALENKTARGDSDDTSAPELRIRGATAFGGIEVHN